MYGPGPPRASPGPAARLLDGTAISSLQPLGVSPSASSRPPSKPPSPGPLGRPQGVAFGS